MANSVMLLIDDSSKWDWIVHLSKESLIIV